MASTCGLRGPPVVIGRAEIGYGVFEPFRGARLRQKSRGRARALGIRARRARGLCQRLARQRTLAGGRPRTRLHVGRDAGRRGRRLRARVCNPGRRSDL